MKYPIILIFFFTNIFHHFAQELNCAVKVSTVEVQSDKTIFTEMEKSITDFMNNTKWTNDVFNASEKIECSIFLNITKRISSNDFKATIQVQSRRPVFNTSYNSTMILNSDDDVTIYYNQFDPIVFTENVYSGELSALLSFYAYMILGTDYDSFSLYGGTPFYEKAFNIANLAQSAKKSDGWLAEGGKQTRYWYVNNILDQFFKPLRECIYMYHREGLDVMYDNNAEGVKKVTEALKKIENIHSIKPNNWNVQLFFYAKSDELTNLYKSVPAGEKNAAVELLKKLNPGNAMKYNRILIAK